MNNAAPLRFYEKGAMEKSPLAPVIPLKSVKGKDEVKKANHTSAKTGVKKSVPDFTEAVIKPKKHDLL
ncbi:MAG: hypothetical protein JST09_10240 [Bacteroidetes bacterium]|nr:hypothetical protein [Bacteroidota bacterium]